MRRFSLCVLALLAISASPAAASTETPAAAVAAQPQPGRDALDLDELGSIHAGASVAVDLLSNQNLSATNSGNSITAGSVRSGDVSFSQNALSGFNGVGNFVINTGANNNLQGSISVNVISTP